MITKIGVGNTYLFNNEKCVVVRRDSAGFEVVIRYHSSNKEETVAAKKFRAEAFPSPTNKEMKNV